MSFAEPPTAPEPAPPRPTRLLVIDDNKSIHQDFRKILGDNIAEDAELDAEAAALFDLEVSAPQRAPYRIDSAYQGQDGLRLLEAAQAEGDPYAVAFVDIRMPPGWDGVETVQRLWAEQPELQVVICTAYSDYSWDEMIQRLGSSDGLVILKKPFDNIEVLQLAHTLTRKWELTRKLQGHLASLDAQVAERTRDLRHTNDRLQLEMEERVRAEQELTRSEERFVKAFQASPFPMAIQSLRTGKYLDANPAFSEMVGREWEAIIGHTPAELHLWTDALQQTVFLEEMRKTLSVKAFEWPLRSPEGFERECLLFGETFSLNQETVALITALDVSEQRRLEYQLRHAQKMEAVGQLAAGVAHDFNNILTVIQGHATMQLSAGGLDAAQAKAMQQVSHAAERASALTRQLLAFSRKQVVQRRALSVNEVARHVHGMLRRVIGEHITLTCDYDPAEPVVYADEVNLEQILMNVVVNARDAMPDGGALSIRIETVEVDEAHVQREPNAQRGTYVRLTFTDTGCGMSEETLARLFEPFFTTKDVGKGTGLGLATVYGIVAQHDGWIEVKSRLNEGTAFKVYLPHTNSPASAAPVAAPAPVATEELTGGGETILLVEDEPNVRDVVAGILQHHGYQVYTAPDGPSALTVWQERKGQVDLLVTDIMMPNGMRGDVLASRLLLDKPSLRVIYSSGYSAEVAMGKDGQLSEIRFLQKPFKLEGLVKAVRETLDEPIAETTPR